MDKSQKQFLDWTVQQDNQQHINASDAELEELYGTPKRKHYPEHDWDLNGNFIPKGR